MRKPTKARRRTAPPRRYSPSQVIERLADIHKLRHPDGTPNYSEIGRRADLPPSTVSRIHRGAQHRDGAIRDRGDSWVLTSATIDKLMRGFGISYAEASGTEPIGAPSKARGTARRSEISADERELIDLWRTLSPQSRAEVHQLASLKAQLEAQAAPNPDALELERLRARLGALLSGDTGKERTA